MEVDVVRSMYFLIVMSLIIYAMFWGTLTVTIFEYLHQKVITLRMMILSMVTAISGIAMMILILLLEPSFRWIYGWLGFVLK